MRQKQAIDVVASRRVSCPNVIPTDMIDASAVSGIIGGMCLKYGTQKHRTKPDSAMQPPDNFENLMIWFIHLGSVRFMFSDKTLHFFSFLSSVFVD